MLNRTVRVRNHSFVSRDKLFFDANIWMFLYGPQRPGGRKMSAYSSAFNRALNAGSRIYIDVLILSEFINTYARRKWNILKRASPSLWGSENFKDFRDSPDFKAVAREIAHSTRQILKHCHRIESGFETLEINSLITRYGSGGTDFNDQVFTQLCGTKGFTLVTDDVDFKGQGISILTANDRLLK